MGVGVGVLEAAALIARKILSGREASLAVIVMLLCFVLLFVAVLSRSPETPLVSAWRRAFVTASVLWSVYLTAITEILSLFHQIAALPVFLLWMGLAIALDAYLLRLVQRRRRLWKHAGFGPLPIAYWLLLGGTAAIAAIALVIALITPPNTPDSLTYHLPRVMHWMQDTTIATYPTHQIVQNMQPPWAEYVLLHLHLLVGGDRLDGIVQWFSFVGSIIGVSLIAEQLGARVRGQIFAAVCAATIHMAIIQASSAQNDLVCAYWVVCAVYYLLLVAAASPIADLGAGASLGLAALTKAVAYVDLLPFLVIFGVLAVRRWRRHVWEPFVVIAVLALALNLGFYTRNITAFGGLLGPPATTQAFSNATYTPDVLLLNVVRNLAVQFGSPFHQVNVTVNGDLYHALEHAYLDPNDPRATLAGSPPFLLRGEQGLWLNDAYTVNPLHLLLILVAGGLCVTVAALRRRRLLLLYLAGLAGAFLVFSLYLRWQAGNNRLMLALFVLGAPLLGVVMEAPQRAASRHARVWLSGVSLGISAVLLLASAPWLLFSQSRPLIGASSILVTPRLDQYFAAYPAAEPGYLAATRYIESRGCTQVGYYVSGPQDRFGYTVGAPSWEYPLWLLLDDNGSGKGHTRIEHVAVTNVTAPLARTPPFASFKPCAIFAIVEPSALNNTLVSNGRTYYLAWGAVGAGFSNAAIVVYVPEASAASHAGGMIGGPVRYSSTTSPAVPIST